MTSTDPVTDYLARLDDALRDVPFGTAREIRAGIAEELDSLDPAAATARIAELGDPATIAAEASDASGSSGPSAASAPAAAPTRFGLGPGYVAVTAVLVGAGGLLLPVLGWIAGIVALWTGRVWTTSERWIATLAPVVAATLVVGVVWAVQLGSSEPSQTSSGGFHPPSVEPITPGLFGAIWMVWLGASIGSVVIGIWLAVTGMRRVRRERP